VGTGGARARERGRFAAREFLGRWSRETGEVTSAVVTDRMLFAYEVGYMCGGRELMALHSSGGLVFEEADDAGERASERGQEAAREFVTYWAGETGEVLFAYEMGYLRGRGDAGLEVLNMFDEIARRRERKGSDAESE
jgi:hypothetical protein